MSVPTIIDTDPGVDDAVALMLAAASSELQLLPSDRSSSAARWL